MRIGRLLKFFGPAWLVMIADVDASSVLGAAETGALFSYGLIWFLLLLTIPLYFIQETSGRIGAVTEEGLGELIRKRYSPTTAKVMAFPMVVTDMVTYAVEYAGIAIGSELIGFPVILSLPFFFVVHILIVSRKRLKITEIVLVAVSSLLIVAFMGSLAERGIMYSSPVYFSPSPGFLFMLAVNAGAVVMPFMLFFQSSATARKVSGIRAEKIFLEKDLAGAAVRSMRIETFAGALVSELLMVIIVMTFSGIGPHIGFVTANELSMALSSFAGSLAPYLFGVGLIGSAFLALVVISLGSAWGFVEAIGRPRDKATPVYILESLPAVIVAMLVPSGMLINIVLYLLVVFVFVLLGPAVLMGIIARDRKIMGREATSLRGQVIYWLNVVVILSFGFAAIL